MNIERANNLDFEDLLAKMGYHPAKRRPTGLYYHSPLRNDKTPSFQVWKGTYYKWVWTDFGHAGNHTILDFIMQYKNTDKKGALAYLDTHYPNSKSTTQKSKTPSNQKSFSFSPQSPPQGSKQIFEKSRVSKEFELVKVMPLQSNTILSYLNSRRIARDVAQRYFSVIQYRRKSDAAQRLYFGFGMANKSGGWEVRSASDEKKFKAGIPTKDISFIEGQEQGRGVVNIFESQTDFVSLLSMFGARQLKGDAIILHGLEFYKRAFTLIHQNEYEHINLFLDNDDEGQNKAALFVKEFGSRIENQSPKFLPHKDLNDALKHELTPTFTAAPNPPQP